MFVNMYYVDDVKCEGPNGGLAVGLGYNRDGTIFFTISGYDGQGGATYFLSSEPGNAAYNGSLAVKRVGDDTCRFIVDSVYVDRVYHSVIILIRVVERTSAALFH